MKRFRPYRVSQEVRDKYAEVFLNAEDFIYPYFVIEGSNRKEEIPSMKGVYRYTIDLLIEDLKDTISLGVDKILLFGVIADELKDKIGSPGTSSDSLICKAIREIKKIYPQILIFTDVCLCEYTSHGHCGLIHDQDVDNDSTLPLLAEMAYQHALAGADFVAPSAMMDGQVQAIRSKLDENHMKTKILAYSAKYASAFYGPFRDAAGSAPSFGNRKTYQMDYRTVSQGVDEVKADIDEGADWVMVKPAMSYLDILAKVHIALPNYPLVAYQVSGEYAMLKVGAESGLFYECAIFEESLTAIKRAGAKYIITYYAKDFIRNRFNR